MSLHDPTSHMRNTPRQSSLVGRVAVAEAAAVVGAVLQGRSTTPVPNPSALEGSQAQVDDSVSPSPVAVTISPQQAPLASGPEAPRVLVPAGANPPADSGSIFVR